MLLRLMETAICFEKEGSRLSVRSQLDVDGIEGIELHTVLVAMDVSFLCFWSALIIYLSLRNELPYFIC